MALAKGQPIIDRTDKDYHSGREGSAIQVWILTALTASFMIAGSYFTGKLFWFYVLWAIASLMALALNIGGATYFFSSRRDLRALASQLQKLECDAQSFIDLFKPTQVQVDAALKDAATDVYTAHLANVELYHKGVLADGKDDPEDTLEALKAEHERIKQSRENAVQFRIEVFRNIRDLCRKQGFKPHESWKRYALQDNLQTLDEARREQKLGEYAEVAGGQGMTVKGITD